MDFFFWVVSLCRQLETQYKDLVEEKMNDDKSGLEKIKANLESELDAITSQLERELKEKQTMGK